ncbi:LysE family translocator [Chelativorans sp. M5D2P16]|uniref:LysE family translocator n=1 Tax=Chelativorans sp. M5D2P16 TaxID=3095678 RepID=UPI002ACA35FD|nr:LysE family translocator [Chelativorans sp. M5D2P16]MDZ5697207.1 LysE family translocator [Chelativorans sp. M5D2P16]
MSLETYLAYALVCLVATVVPGPTNMLIVANGIRQGVKAGLLNVAGTLAGLSVMIAVVSVGLTSVVEIAGHWFAWIKLAGAAYLCWLGLKILRSSGAPLERSPAGHPRRGFLLQGLLVSLGNPKQLLFFGALLPQFIDPAGNHVLQIALLGGTALLFSAMSDGGYAIAAGSLGRRLGAAAMRRICRIGGTFLIGGGLWLAFSRAR